ncbi:hypothetical protein SGL43_06593 [Streptomyces globisporus]|uniref:Uncharacterized protein n=1 Tax=Streptomyces globisporus TaxID=1908 RepID=A0ABN8VE77_STRGL|nr:hypothetical protein [Streptomyces globisporus]CAH9419538.1 hypothetical protein SGL43_06593 [Streptomyces globisporus]
MTAQTAWPENVIARYLTLAGATVDLTHRNETEDGKKKATHAACTGCKATTTKTWADSYPNYGRPGVTEFQNQGVGDRSARAWAQEHAETCRALAAPTAPVAAPEPQADPEPRRRLWFPTRRKTA